MRKKMCGGENRRENGFGCIVLSPKRARVHLCMHTLFHVSTGVKTGASAVGVLR